MTKEEKLKRLNQLSEEMQELYVSIFEDIGKDLEVLDILKKAFLNNDVDVKPKCKKCFNLLELDVSEWLKFKQWLEGE